VGGKKRGVARAIVVAGSPPARSFAPLPNAGAFCRDRASSPLSSLGPHRFGRPVIEQESGGVWGSRAALSIHARQADQSALGPFPDGRGKISFRPRKLPRFDQTPFYIKPLKQRAGPPGSGKSAIKNVAGSGMAAELANRHDLAKLVF
jgi:hypothetical protein